MTTYITDENGNRASVERFGSAQAAQTALDSCIGCTRCTDCSNCDGCTDCTDCIRCTDRFGTALSKTKTHIRPVHTKNYCDNRDALKRLQSGKFRSFKKQRIARLERLIAKAEQQYPRCKTIYAMLQAVR